MKIKPNRNKLATGETKAGENERAAAGDSGHNPNYVAEAANTAEAERQLRPTVNVLPGDPEVSGDAGPTTLGDATAEAVKAEQAQSAINASPLPGDRQDACPTTGSKRRNGKIACLPAVIRDEVCQRMLDGEDGSKILPWLNALPETQKMLGESFDGLPVSPDNLSKWRTGGYVDWLHERELMEWTQARAEFSLKLGQTAGLDLNRGNSTLLSASIMQVLEDIHVAVKPGQAATPEKRAENMNFLRKAIQSLSLCVARLRKGDHDAVAQRLAREKFEFDASKRAVDAAFELKIIANDTTKSQKERIDEARMLVFGCTPE